MKILVIGGTRFVGRHFVSRWLCTKTTHGSEWIINFNLSHRLHKPLESHQRELVDRSFSLKRGRKGKIHQLTLMVFVGRSDWYVGRTEGIHPLTVGGILDFCAKP